MIPADVSKLAALFHAAHAKGCRLPSPTPIALPQALEDAYRVQQATLMLRADAAAGFKIGLTSAPAQEAFGVSAPIAGSLAGPDIRRSPATIRVGQHLRVAEAEIVFEIGEDLPASKAPFSEQAVGKAVAGLYAGIEICNSRYGPDDVPLAHLVADNSNADLLVIGEPLRGIGVGDLLDLPVELQHRGERCASGSTAKVLGGPLAACTWLANWLASCGDGLRRGQYIASGSCTGITEIPTDGMVVARFGNLGQAAVEFVTVAPGEIEE